GCDIPGEYDPLIAKLIAWGPDRPTSLARLQRCLQEIQLTGAPTNLPLLQRILEQPSFVQGSYTTDLVHSPGELHLAGVHQSTGEGRAQPSTLPRDLAVAAAMVFMRRSQFFQPVQPARLRSGWHRDSRRLPE
ncbi:MAG: hypothetical protein JXB15_04860, partial [Anaerolineales bacterium]|nr:hypothetical protein [Anaerolineales bacterium]